MADLAVPCFFMLSFFFSGEISTWDKVKKRVVRLYLPFCFWGIVGFIGRTVHEHLFQPKLLLMQLVFGQSCNSMLWFMSILMLITLTVYLIQRFLGRYAMVGYAFLFVACFLLNYFNLNFLLWNKCSPYVATTMGRYVEMFPFAVAGIFMSKVMASNYTRVNILVVSILMVFIGMALRILHFEFSYTGYGYGGFVRFLCACGIVGICLLSNDWLNDRIPDRIGKIVVIASGFTPGVYFMCKLVGEAVKSLNMLSESGAVLTIVVCLSASLIVAVMRKCHLKRLVC